MNHFPTLYSDRLILRKLNVEDIPALVRHANNKKIADRIVNIPFPYREPQAAMRISYVVQGFKEQGRYVFAVIHKERDELIGEISLHRNNANRNQAQLAYWIGESFWGQGFATEAAKTIIRYGFETLGLELVYADCRPENIASEKVMQHCGMERVENRGDLLLYKVSP